tara:strand:- start:94 stop:651 length:558 start_codon:yes stop_codon:yes gene_type:complete
MDCPTVLEKLREKIIEIKEVNEKAVILEGKISRLNNLYLDTPYQVQIDEIFLQYVEDLKYIVQNTTYCIDKTDIDVYNQIIFLTHGYHFIFNNFIENRMTKPVHETMNNPRIIFDQIFFQRKPLNEQQTEIALELLNDMRYMYNAILNTKDEFIFDLSILTYNNSKNNKVIISFLENLHNELITT